MTEAGRATRIQVRAPGKVNVFLGVGAVRDDGYHAVATAYQALSVADEVTVEHADRITVRVEAPDGTPLKYGGPNLVLRAAKALAKRGGYSGGAAITVEKRLPLNGGMGGTSTNAAAALVACDALWGLGSTRDELMKLAARIGADVPFFLLGGTAVGTGRGDRLSHALATGSFSWVIVPHARGVPMTDVYRTLDEHRAEHAASLGPAADEPAVPVEVLHALRAGDPHMLADAMHNDLQVAAFKLVPELPALIELGETNGALAGIVVGSGPTVAFLVADDESAVSVQVALSAFGHTAIRATSPVPGGRSVVEGIGRAGSR